MPIYLSQKAFDEKWREIDYRKTTLRREIAEKIANAKELGDLSENFEYQEAKEEQGFNEAKIAELEMQVHDVVIVKESLGGQTITLGSTFRVFVGTTSKTFTLVGSHEADPTQWKISNESPLGKQFVNAKVGDKIKIELDSGTQEFEIIEIL